MAPIEFKDFTQDEIDILERELYFAEREKELENVLIGTQKAMAECENNMVQQFYEHEKAMAEREKAMAEREKALAEREKALAEREKALEKAPKKTKKFSVVYIENYRDCEPESECIGEFTDEKSAIAATIEWLVVNSKGGFDECDLNQLLKDQCDEDYEGELNEEELIKYMIKKCKTWNGLRKVCENYGNSYFEDDDGWVLKKI